MKSMMLVSRLGAMVLRLMTPNPGTTLIPLMVGVLAGSVAYWRSGLAATRFVEVKA